MTVSVALHTTILGAIAAARFAKSKVEDRNAIDALLELVRQSLVELEIALTGAVMEQLRGERSDEAIPKHKIASLSLAMTNPFEMH